MVDVMVLVTSKVVVCSWCPHPRVLVTGKVVVYVVMTVVEAPYGGSPEELTGETTEPGKDDESYDPTRVLVPDRFSLLMRLTWVGWGAGASSGSSARWVHSHRLSLGLTIKSALAYHSHGR